MDGNDEYRCPYLIIYDNPEWWEEVMLAYGAYDKGFLPHEGGMRDQNVLFPRIMRIISNAIHTCDDLGEQRVSPKQGMSLLGKE